MIIGNSADKVDRNYKLYQETLTNGGHTDDSVAGRYLVATVNLGKVDKDDYVSFSTLVNRGENVGTWLHEGEIHVDEVWGTDSLREAFMLGHGNKEISIYDREEKKAITLNY